MRWLLDLLYAFAAVVTVPVWLVRLMRTGKIRTDWPGRFGRVRPPLAPRSGARPRLLIHAVSVGEVNAVRLLVERLRSWRDAQGKNAAGGIEVVIATTTDTGFARANALWGATNPDTGVVSVVRYPFDLSFPVNRFLRAVDPDAVALVELEVWPNFAAACARRDVALCVLNGRLTARSFRRYRMVRWAMRRAFERLAFAAVQNEAYAERFHAMGVPRERVLITGTMKWDTAVIADEVDGADRLVAEMGIDRTRPMIVAGSTAPGEHELLHAATPAGVQLLCAPRKPEWFDDAASALPGCVRRSATTANPKSRIQNPKSGSDRFLLDTIGELRQAYALADVVVIGRSFGDLHGSDMMEPAALGKAVIVGPAVSDFQDTVVALLQGDGIVQTTTAELPRVIAELLANPARRARLAANARRVIREHQGATDRHAEMLRSLIDSHNRSKNPPPQR